MREAYLLGVTHLCLSPQMQKLVDYAFG